MVHWQLTRMESIICYTHDISYLVQKITKMKISKQNSRTVLFLISKTSIVNGRLQSTVQSSWLFGLAGHSRSSCCVLGEIQNVDQTKNSFRVSLIKILSVGFQRDFELKLWIPSEIWQCSSMVKLRIEAQNDESDIFLILKIRLHFKT